MFFLISFRKKRFSFESPLVNSTSQVSSWPLGITLSAVTTQHSLDCFVRTKQPCPTLSLSLPRFLKISQTAVTITSVPFCSVSFLANDDSRSISNNNYHTLWTNSNRVYVIAFHFKVAGSNKIVKQTFLPDVTVPHYFTYLRLLTPVSSTLND